ncbi:large ribosomal subunit protein uL22m-like [Hydra vulgaris]|uniref:Large ribosomal subunit protein uL22m n=1 Tax=Hydra vulgaris TaxID=6087 RepID=A0ABM4D069_HYDVU
MSFLSNAYLQFLKCDISKSLKIIQSCASNSYFSVTRVKLGRSPEEKKKDEGIPEPPPVEICHCRRDIRIAPKKMLLSANLVARLPINEAIAQAQFSIKGASEVVKEVLKEAQEIAVKKYGVEDPSYLYVDQSFIGRGQHLKRINYRGQGRMDIMRRHYCHYFVILKEGTPPGKNISRTRSRYLTPLEKKLRYPKTIKNSLAWW